MAHRKQVNIPLSGSGAAFISARKFLCVPMSDDEMEVLRLWLSDNAPAKILQLMARGVLVPAEAVQ
ncbi:hypothetical protein [Cypionkella sp. TWP1-2-1b2]|uniref:hypothetical protein n=1 Tax=Cypionkella sp. TWP1-2-1b2 TaxID=2804675 RepID=UPI003CE91228